MSNYIKLANGRLAGSIGHGRDDVPSSPRLIVMEVNAKEADAIQDLVGALRQLGVHPDFEPGVTALNNAVPNCTLCNTRLRLGQPTNFTHDGEPGYLCDGHNNDTNLRLCGSCGYWTDTFTTTHNTPTGVLCTRCTQHEA
jgi:hypothetical protein